jgi:hypothetical protein
MSLKLNIVALAPNIVEIYHASLGTICRFIESGHKAYIIIVEQERYTSTETRQVIQRQCKSLGIHETYFADGFDYSSVTQHNADLINSFIKVSDPSIIIMPFSQSLNHTRKILGKTSLIASRQSGTILMYEIDDNTDYIPTVFIPVSPAIASTKRQYLKDSYSISHSSSLEGSKKGSMASYSDAHNIMDMAVNINSNDVHNSRDNAREQHHHVRRMANKSENNSRHIVSPNSNERLISESNVELFMSHRMILVDDFGLWR